jgi:hypothetical protein
MKRAIRPWLARDPGEKMVFLGGPRRERLEPTGGLFRAAHGNSKVLPSAYGECGRGIRRPAGQGAAIS